MTARKAAETADTGATEASTGADLSDALYCEHDRIGVQCERCQAQAAGRQFHVNEAGTVRAVAEEPPTVA